MDLTMGFSTKFSRSSSEYKNNANMEYGNFRQLKQQDNLNIRKNKKDQQFKMKRGMADSTTHVDMMDIHKAISAFLKPSSDQQQMDTMTNIIYCLSVEGVDEVATKAIIQGGVLRHLVSLLQSENQDWVYAAIWSLVNITATNFTKEVAEHCAVPALITHLCNNPSPEIRELAAWCLANIAGDGAELRDLVMAEGALQPL
jgi:importin subunit alpha-2